MNNISTQEQAALAVLKSTKVDILEAALVAKEALAAGRGRVKRARKCIAAGAEALQKQEKTVTFEKAVAAGRVHPPGAGCAAAYLRQLPPALLPQLQ